MKIGIVLSVVTLCACEANGIVSSVDGSGGGFQGPENIGGKGSIAGFGGGGVTSFTDPVVVAETPPPPISGGTLFVSDASRIAAVSDPDHDQLVLVNLDDAKVTATIAFEPGDEPGRVVEDSAGRFHVALRSGGAVAIVDPQAGTLLERRAACTYPRGLAYEASSDVIYVACAEGALVTLPAAGGEATRSVQLVRDLRDIVVENGRLWVSVFRTAEILRVDADGAIVERQRPPALRMGGIDTAGALVAWKMLADPNGGVLVLHQRAQLGEIIIEEGGYGAGTCGGIVEGAVTQVDAGEPPETSTASFSSALAVDMAIEGDDVLMASAGAVQSGSLNVFLPAAPRFNRENLELSSEPEFSTCNFFESGLGTLTVAGQVVAVDFDGSTPVYQLREPGTLIIGERGVTLPGDSNLDTGHLLFHAATVVGLACASCHPEGREDGHTWNFAGFGPRRTQSVGGMLAGTAPFHWAGDEATFAHLVEDVMTGRMVGPALTSDHGTALMNWIDSIPIMAAPAAPDADAVLRGKLLFETEEVACSTCHAGETLTNNKSYDVGTGSALQVPSLRGLAWRAPFLHDGCAATIEDRFGSCGGNLHGDVSGLSDAERSDLVAYLNAL
jgi:hypothetical protein